MARYLVRFDDICPTMNWPMWDRIEALLLDRGVRPLVAVVPSNRDERLAVNEPRADFWERVRSWQALGWTIGVHGYEHLYVTKESATYGWDARSEFAGLPADEQQRKLRASLAIFERERVRPEVWVAPNHSFDEITLQVLRREGMNVVCDGLSRYPYVDQRGIMWIPQQLWGFRPRRAGLWTVCFHHNGWTEANFAALDWNLRKYENRLVDVPGIVSNYMHRRRTLADVLFMRQRLALRRLKRSEVARNTRRLARLDP
jgi:predicted deacetylase